MITLYGITRSRASRCLWMLEELGVPYERNKVSYLDGGNRTPEYAAINPNQKLPALVDGDVKLFESMAINLYLADKYGGGLWPDTPEQRGLCYQWSLWVMTEAESLLLQVLLHTALLPEERRNPEKVPEAIEGLKKPFGVLNAALEGKSYLLGDTFTVADLNVASVMSWAKVTRIPLDDFPNIQDWLSRCLDRPAQKKVMATRKEE